MKVIVPLSFQSPAVCVYNLKGRLTFIVVDFTFFVLEIFDKKYLTYVQLALRSGRIFSRIKSTYSHVVQKIRPKSKFVRRTPKLVSAWKTPSGVFGVVFSTQSRTDSRISTANLLASKRSFFDWVPLQEGCNAKFDSKHCTPQRLSSY